MLEVRVYYKDRTGTTIEMPLEENEYLILGRKEDLEQLISLMPEAKYSLSKFRDEDTFIAIIAKTPKGMVLRD